MARIVIVGGGITGLSAAYELQRRGGHDVTLMERSARLGGKIVTHSREGFLIEGGPDSIYTSKPWALELMCELGLEEELVEPMGSGFSLFVGGRLHAVPSALASLIPTASSALESVGFLGAAARRRIQSEHRVAKGKGDDESIASFFRRRFGSKFSKTLAEPLLAGIHAGDPEKLSMMALYPSYIGLEQTHGSLTARPSGGPHPPRRPNFITLRGGLQRLVDELVFGLKGVQVRLNCVIDGIERTHAGGLRILGAEAIEADAVILAVPAYAAAKLLANVAQEASASLGQIRHVSTAVVSLAYSISAFPKGLCGNGFLVPAEEPSAITGCTFSSVKWPARAPQGEALIRTFVGRDGGVSVDDLSDAQLSEGAEVSIAKALHVKEAPRFAWVDRWTRAMPQYALGHLDLMKDLDANLASIPVILAGASYRGSGVPDCVRQGREAAVMIEQRLSGS